MIATIIITSPQLSAIGNEQLSTKQIMGKMGLSHREHFRADILTVAISQGLISPTNTKIRITFDKNIFLLN